ncbi:MAG: OmpA family protein [Endomicrobium sp.]|jgi:peptidoglycan-associated lipoprotein|nr:OmpA family protein [Endomicrobium sp.]
MKKVVILCFIGLFVCSFGCKRQDIKKENINNGEIETIHFSDEPSVRGDSEVNSNLKIVYFDFDKSDLNEESLESLKRNAAYLSKNLSLKVVVEGHTDNRGTSGYNLSLGQRRALKVKDYYIKFGISPNRIATISYGSEKPVIDENNDIAWSKNRRAETKTLN